MEYIKMNNLSEKMFTAVWNVYQYSFPDYEKRKMETHCKAMKNSRFNAMGVFENAKFVGMIFYWEFDGLSYIEHFAIVKELRGKNYGTKILADFCEKRQNVLLEIDPPVEEVSKKREHFYHRLGFVTSEFSYTHHSYLEEDVPHTLVMMSYKKPLCEDDFESFKQLMFGTIMNYSGKVNIE